MQSPAVLEPAMTSNEWQETAFGAYSTSPKVFSIGLVLSRSHGEGVIGISYEAPTPELAQTGSNVITESYLNFLAKRELQTESHTLRQLQSQEIEFEDQLERLQNKKRDLTTEHNDRTIGDELDRMTRVRDTMKIELDKVRFDLANLGVDTTNEGAQAGQLTIEQLASQDPKLASMLQEQARLESDVEFKTRLGLGERHKEMRQARAALDTLNAQIEDYAQSLRGSGRNRLGYG